MKQVNGKKENDVIYLNDLNEELTLNKVIENITEYVVIYDKYSVATLSVDLVGDECLDDYCDKYEFSNGTYFVDKGITLMFEGYCLYHSELINEERFQKALKMFRDIAKYLRPYFENRIYEV